MFYYEDVLSRDSYQSPPLGQADALRYATNVGYGYIHGADQRINVDFLQPYQSVCPSGRSLISHQLLNRLGLDFQGIQ